jgi:zinc/manganese transport system substrate-binding protein
MVVGLSCIFGFRAEAKLNVVATTSDIGALLERVAGEQAGVEVIAKGTQDPHFIEPKPSYMVKVAKADLLVSNGLSLEEGWLPNLIQGGRNPKVKPGSKGNLVLGSHAEPLDVSGGGVSRAAGDVHPDGNPHFALDPIRMGSLAIVVAERLGELDTANRGQFIERAKLLQRELETKAKEWKERIAKSGVKQIVTYHNDLRYFLERFGLQAAAFLEPKPGVPPTAQHLIDTANLIRRDKISVILVENFFDTKIAERLASDVPSVKVRVVGIAVGSKPELKSTIDVIEQLVTAIEGKSI